MRKYALLVIIIIALLTTNNSFCYSQSKELLKDKFIIVLDIQDHYIEQIDDSTSQALISNINDIILKADPNKVIYIKSIIKELAITLRGFKIDTIPNLEFEERLCIVSDNVFEKNKANAFTVKEMNEFLISNSAKEIVVIGLLAEYCVNQTLLGGDKNGFEMYLVSDAILGESDKSKEKVFKKLYKKGVKKL